MKLRLDKDGAVGSSSLKLKCHWNQTHDQRLIKQLQISFFAICTEVENCLEKFLKSEKVIIENKQ